MALIELHGVTKNYNDGDVPALRALDLALDAGLITAIMGPSGCGKSTLLNLIGGLDRPTNGEVILDGARVDRLSETAAARMRRTKVGYIFQFFQLLDDLTVLDNVAVAAQLAGVSGREFARARIAAARPARAGGVRRQVSGHAQRRRTAAAGHRPSGDQRARGHPRGRTDRRA